MKIILTEDVPGVGKQYEVRNVSEGYARNFLFSKKIARLATPAIMKDLEERRRKEEKEGVEGMKRINEIAQALRGRYFEFPVKTNNEGITFGSINNEAILKALRDVGSIGKERAEISLARPIKEIGDHTVSVHFRKGVSAEIIVRLLKQA